MHCDAVDIWVGQAFPGLKAKLRRERMEDQRQQVAMRYDN
jgi:hypothetical protein